MSARDVLHPRRVPDPEDPVFSAWRIARVAHQLTHDPAHLFFRELVGESDAHIAQGQLAVVRQDQPGNRAADLPERE